MKSLSILLVGCGKMGGAILSGWIKSNSEYYKITVISPEVSNEHLFDVVNYCDSYNELPKNYFPDIVVLAVKPQKVGDILKYYADFASRGSLFISIIAGKTISYFKDNLGNNLEMVRAMPNLPALESCGVTVLYADKNVSSEKREMSKELLLSVGTVHWIDEEDKMNAVTAISGSGPAYLFYFMECLINAAKELGIDDELSVDIIKETIYGSAKIASNRNSDLSVLRKNVTSPNGTTKAALDEFMNDDALIKIVNKATSAAKRKAIELNS